MHHAVRSKVTKYYHKYLSKYIKEQISKEQILLIRSHLVSTSVDIYEIKKGKLPDASNLWIWIKWFEDALQECGVLEDDDPNNVIKSGGQHYHWVDNEENRALVFNIQLISKKHYS